MRKYFALYFTVLLALSLLLSSCSSCNPIARIKEKIQAAVGSTAEEDSEDESLSPEEQQVSDVLTGKTNLDELSVDELLAYIDALQDPENAGLIQGAEYDILYKDEDLSGFRADAELSDDYPAGASVATVSDVPWEDKSWETLDITDGMSPEDKAAYEQALQELENFDADEFQTGIDEMLKGYEGFEDYDPDARETDDSGDNGDNPELAYDWPDNEFTKQLPKPDFENIMVVTDEESMTVVAMNSTVEEAREYAEKLKKAGFTESLDENERKVEGAVVYSFTASNGKGYEISMIHTSGMTNVSISKQ